MGPDNEFDWLPAGPGAMEPHRDLEHARLDDVEISTAIFNWEKSRCSVASK